MAQLKDSLVTGDLRVTGTVYGQLNGSSTSAALNTTNNSVAYFSDTNGTFAYKSSANGVLYATSANGALSFGTLPIAQGGTGKTTAAAAWTALGGGASGKHADSYFALSGHTHTTSLATSTGTSTVTMAANTKYVLTAGETSVIFTTPPDSNTDTKVTVTNTNPTSGTWYYPVWYTGTSGTGGLNANNGLRYYSLDGTASALGNSYLQLGNGTASGTAGNKRGIIRLYGNGAYYTDFVAANVTANRTLTLPLVTGNGNLVGTTTTSAVGSYTKPVYIAANGIATAALNISSGTAAPSGGSNGDVYIRTGAQALEDVWETLWTGQLQGGSSQAISMSAYKKLRVWAYSYAQQISFLVDLEYPCTLNQHNSNYTYYAGGVAPTWTSGSKLELHSCAVGVNSAKTTLYCEFLGYHRESAAYARNANASYFVYKVEGCK